MSHVFISYKHSDGDFAQILANKIEEAGFIVWKDDDDDKLPAGADWRTKIDQAIKDAFALIVVMTPEAKASEYIIYECGFAHGANVQVVPIMLKTTDMHPRLHVLQYLDFSTSDRKNRPWPTLIAALRLHANVYKERAINCAKDISALIDALYDINDEVANRAIDILTRIGMPSVGYLLKALCDTNVRVRRNAATALGNIREKIAVPGLLEALYDTDEMVLKCAAIALGSIGIPSVPGLLKVLIDHECREKMRADVALALGKAGGFEAVRGLLEALGNDEAKIVRSRAALALGQIGHTYAMNGLLKALVNDQEQDVRLQAVESLALIRHSDAISGLRDALATEEKEEIRSTISHVIQYLENNTSIN